MSFRIDHKAEELALVTRVVVWGDQQAFRKLVEAYQYRVRRLFLVHSGGDEQLSKDLAQDTFIRVWQQLHGFRHAASFSTWLYSIAYRIWLDHLRTVRQPLFEPDGGGDVEDSGGRADLMMEQEEARRGVRKAILRLTPAERTCITMFYLDRMSVRSIATVTGMSSQAVKTCLSRGRSHLKEIIGKNYGNER